jgi:hypothetical protein
MSGNLLEKPKDNTDFKSKVSVITKDFKLGTADRCDRCGAQAYVQVQLDKGQELMFCGHHYVAQKASLLPLPAVLTVRDESGRLHIKPAPPKDD